MDLRLKDKIILITASSNGIGMATAIGFLKEGAKVIINGRNEERLNNLNEDLNNRFGQGSVFAICGDATEEETINKMVSFVESRWGKIDVLVPCVGSGKPSNSDKLDIGEWKRFLDINLLCNVNLIDKSIPLLLKGESPSITLISSVISLSRASAPYAYAASKSAILALNSYMAGDYKEIGIRTNCVIPGNVIFEGGRWEELRKQDPLGTDEYIVNNVPMNRFGTPEEIADAIVFLSSDRAAFINGAVLTVDGGQCRSIK